MKNNNKLSKIHPETSFLKYAIEKIGIFKAWKTLNSTILFCAGYFSGKQHFAGKGEKVATLFISTLSTV